MSGSLRIFVSAGEISGDRMLGDILRPLRTRFPDLELRGLGGPAAEACGLVPLFPIRATAFNGAWDVICNAPLALRLYRTALSEIKRFRPRLALLVDYPGLNLRLARAARNLGVTVCFVAPPQAWAYRNPARKLRRAAESLRGCHVHALFPFEAEAFAAVAAGVTVGHFFAAPPPCGPASGNPALDEAGASHPLARGNRLLLCPGSRISVLRRNLPAWLELLHPSPGSGMRAGTASGDGQGEGVSILVPAHLAATARDLVSSRLRPGRALDIRFHTDRDSAFAEARHAIAFPGTITMELALACIPTLVLAIVDPLTLALGKRLLRDSRLALPNLFAEKDVFPEWAGRAPGPRPELFRELERRRDREIAWGENLEKWAGKMGSSGGAQIVCEVCSAILSSPAPGQDPPRGAPALPKAANSE